MKRNEFISLIEEVYEELKVEFPTLKIQKYRDGGSVAFFMSTNDIVMCAPIQTTIDENCRCIMWFNKIEILKAGCNRFEDSYNTENIIGSIMFDGLPFDTIENTEKRDKYKNDIKIFLKSLRLNNYIKN